VIASILLGLREGVREVSANRFRSLLATFAIVLGVGALLATLALSAGMAEAERRFLVDLGGIEHVYIESLPTDEEEAVSRALSPGKTYRDVLALRRGAPMVDLATPDHFLQPRPTVALGNKTMGNAYVVGTDEDYREAFNHRLLAGRFITALDRERKQRVCVIGRRVAAGLDLAPGQAVGRRIQIGGVGFRVVGEFPEYPYEWKNRHLVIPLATAWSVFRPGDEAGKPLPLDPRISGISVKIRDAGLFDATVDQMRAILLRTHNGVLDFGFNTEEDWLEAIEGRIFATRMTGTLIAAVSLLVGGVGIANVMLASLKQRTREIGIRRAVGALGRDIFVQMLVETLLLGLVGGLLGVGAGWVLVRQMTVLLKEGAAPVFEPGAFVVSFLSALVVSVAAGLYPAWRGSQVSPASALRGE
jgi:putative ABC transport system permease protein